MKKLYIAPVVEIEEVEALCADAINPQSLHEEVVTPIPEGGIPGSTPGTEETPGTDEGGIGAKGGGFIWDDEF